MEAQQPLLDKEPIKLNGDKPVNVQEILEGLSDEDRSVLLDCWYDLATKLGTPKELKKELRNLRNFKIIEAIEDLLDAWIMRKTAAVATTSELIKILKNVGCNDLAEKIRINYLIPENLCVPEEPKYQLRTENDLRAPDAETFLPNTLYPCNFTNIASTMRTKRYSRFEQKTKRVYVCIGILLILMVVSCIVVYKIYKSKVSVNNNGTKIQCNNDAIGKHETDNFYYKILNVSSYEDFITSSLTSYNSSIYIAITNPAAWKSQYEFSNKSCLITSIRLAGNYSIYNIINMVKYFPNLQRLYLERSDSLSVEHLYHSTDNPEKLICPTNLPNLKSLTLNFSGFYTPLYQHLDNCFSFQNLENFQITKGNISDENIVYIGSMISRSLKLQKLKISAYFQISHKVFYSPQIKMSHVKEIVINNLNPWSKISKNFVIELGNEFCDTFSNLEVFKSQSGCLLFSNRHQLFRCVSLKSLEVSLYVDYETSVNLGLFHKLPNLHTAIIYLRFSQCPLPIHRKQIEIEKLSKNNSNLTICSRDCPLKIKRNESCLTRSKSFG